MRKSPPDANGSCPPGPATEAATDSLPAIEEPFGPEETDRLVSRIQLYGA
jgi:hypothetical protein